MNILGINFGHPDASAVLLKDGQWLFGSEEERFKRVKHWEGFPVEAISFCLESADISFEQLDFIAVAGDKTANLFRRMLFSLQHPNYLIKRNKAVGNFNKEWNQYFPHGLLHDKLRFVEHHRSHLASAFYSSPFEESMIYSLDGSGDFSTSMWAIGKGNSIKVLGNTSFPHSLGLFYTAASQYLGFQEVGDEYKVMGLAAYGKPAFFEKLLSMFQLQKDGTFKLKNEFFKWNKPLIGEGNLYGYPKIPLFFSKLWDTKCGKSRRSEEKLSSIHADFAASVQKVFEFILMRRLNYLAEICVVRNLCLAGGSIQNSVAIGKIKSLTPFKNIYVPCASHDAGISLGAAQWVHFQEGKGVRTEAIFHSFKGKCFTDDEIKAVCIEKKWHFQEYRMEEIIYEAVSILLSGGIIGWFQGRAEFGPRSLGNRSILANPLIPGIKDTLNVAIKNREKFRPFALSVLAEYQQEYIGYCDFLPFMEQVKGINGKELKAIGAFFHIDNTIRIQSVRKEENELFHKLITSFHKESGVPALINTSFNEKEPIVHSPADAIDCFKRTGIDFLIMGNILIQKPNIT
jgi:carbamoyltransferase